MPFPQPVFQSRQWKHQNINVNIKDTRKRHEHCFGVFIINFEQISHIVLVFPSLTLKKRMPTKSVPLKSHLETQRYMYSDPISSNYVIGRWIWCGISYVQREFETIERFRNSLRRVCTTYGASSGFPVSIVLNLFHLVLQNYIENWLFFKFNFLADMQRILRCFL